MSTIRSTKAQRNDGADEDEQDHVQITSHRDVLRTQLETTCKLNKAVFSTWTCTTGLVCWFEINCIMLDATLIPHERSPSQAEFELMSKQPARARLAWLLERIPRACRGPPRAPPTAFPGPTVAQTAQQSAAHHSAPRYICTITRSSETNRAESGAEEDQG